ncbi:MAG: ABC-ATPase domain-containing protein [Firmicutes bacterium]|nr:ABC-ATPase domain-containing protein [Bacillota bacterium]
MLTQKDLTHILNRIDGKGYKAYKDLQGTYQFDDFTLFIDYVQGDPFASPSRIRVRVDMARAGIPQGLFSVKARKTALEDFFTRQIEAAIHRMSSKVMGTGKSGLISIIRCGQEIMERTSVVITEAYIEARLSIGLPARGRTVLGKQAQKMFTQQLAEIVGKGMLYRSIDGAKAKKHVELTEDQEMLRSMLKDRGLVAFVANGSILPRESGVSDRPLKGGHVIVFQSPQSLEVSVELPHAGTIKGMGIRQGVTLIVGGGYHGKSTLLKAVERGIYNHIPGDGREYVITVNNAVKIRAEDGRFVENVDISPFINNLPSKQNTGRFSTLNASGSTSQAANISEAIEAQTELLLLDEDTCATNFMIRDARMQRLVHSEKEPITPFIDRVKQLYNCLNISTLLVIGGAGDYFDVADTVILMDEYVPYEQTEQAKQIADQFPAQRMVTGHDTFEISLQRVPLPVGFEIQSRKEKVKSKGTLSILYGYHEIDLQDVEQLVDSSQTTAIGLIMQYIKKKYVDGQGTLSEILQKVYDDMERYGLDVIAPFQGQHPGDYAMPRIQETFAAINRLRTLKVK